MAEVPCLCGLFLTFATPPPALCSRTTKRQIIRPEPRNPDICFFHFALSLSSFRPCCNSVAHVLWVWAIPSWHYTAGLTSGPAVRSYPEVLLELHSQFWFAVLHTFMKTKWRKYPVQSWFYSISCTYLINEFSCLLVFGSVDNGGWRPWLKSACVSN